MSRRRKKKRINIYKILLALLLLFAIVFVAYKIITMPKEPEKVLMVDVTNKDINIVKEEL